MNILFEDAHLLVVSKPAGLSTQAPPIAGATLETEVRAYLDNAYVGTVHRLDRPVSGVVLWAKNPRAARRLARQFERREARKEYWAVLERRGAMPLDGLWEDALLFDPAGTGVKTSQVVAAGTPRSQEARTRFQVVPGVTAPEGWTALALWPETGRTHQLRVQSAAHAGPIAGDALYGALTPFPDGIALHARSLTLVHPVTDCRVTFTAALPAAWATAGVTWPTASR
jgi:23S rRNA pseudouridine1911/1915/1917 synthase